MTESDFAELVARACHDIRTPLAVAHGFARTIERVGLDAAEAPTFLGHVVSSTKELDQLVVALSTLAREQAGGLKLRPVDVELNDLAAAACELAHGRLLGVEASIEPVHAEGTVVVARDALVLAVADIAASLVRAGAASVTVCGFEVATDDADAGARLEEKADLRLLAARAVLAASGVQ